MKYILIDTSIYVSFLEAGFKVTENIEALKNLFKILENNKINLILPDVICLEYKRLREEKEKELRCQVPIFLRQVSTTFLGI